ncbi:MAG: hypothetical protein H0T84_05445 [Tatlockia sp.]|nr:hypothetical protein [Tatlockia sp.]
MANLEEILEYSSRVLQNTQLEDRNGNIIFANAFEAGKTIFKKITPGFFTPYQSGKDFGMNMALSLTAPIYAPLLLGTLTAIFAIATAVAAVTMVGSLLFAGATFCFDSELAQDALVISLIAGGLTLAGLLSTLILAVGALVSAPLQLTQFATRSLASIPTLLCDAPANEEDSMVFAFS